MPSQHPSFFTCSSTCPGVVMDICSKLAFVHSPEKQPSLIPASGESEAKIMFCISRTVLAVEASAQLSLCLLVNNWHPVPPQHGGSDMLGAEFWPVREPVPRELSSKKIRGLFLEDCTG